MFSFNFLDPRRVVERIADNRDKTRRDDSMIAADCFGFTTMLWFGYDSFFLDN